MCDKESNFRVQTFSIPTKRPTSLTNWWLLLAAMKLRYSASVNATSWSRILNQCSNTCVHFCATRKFFNRINFFSYTRQIYASNMRVLIQLICCFCFVRFSAEAIINSVGHHTTLPAGNPVRRVLADGMINCLIVKKKSGKGQSSVAPLSLFSWMIHYWRSLRNLVYFFFCSSSRIRQVLEHKSFFFILTNHKHQNKDPNN